MYFFYFSVLGAMMPFWSLYLDYLAFDSVQIGLLFAAPMLVRIIMPNIWGHLADTKNSRVWFLRFGLSCAFLTFSALLLAKSFFAVLAFLVLHSIFWNGMLALTEAEVIERLRKQANAYGRIRVWGSIGFIVFVLVLGWVFDQISIRHLPFILFALLACTMCSSFALPIGERTEKRDLVSAKTFITEALDKRSLVFFIVMVIVHASHGAYYVFFSIYLEQLAYTRTEIGIFWTLGVIAEIVLFFLAHKIIPHFSLYFLLMLSLVLTALRWCGIALLSEFAVLLIFIQCLHAFSFGMIHLVSVDYCRQRFRPETLSRAQALINATGYGIGGALGTFLSGYIWPMGGDILFLSAAAFTTFAIVLALMYLRNCAVLGSRKAAA
jgi:PPP family 3-phenylpropionic acid transporter